MTWPSRVLPLLLLEAWLPLLALGGPSDTSAADCFWFKRAGTYVGHGAVPYDVPTNLSMPPAWTWENEDNELMRHGPVIDGERNIYLVVSSGRIIKFNPDGQVLWSWRSAETEGLITTSPFLYRGWLYVVTMGWPVGRYINVHALDMETGRQVLKAPGPRSGIMNGDSATIHAAEGVLLGAVQDELNRLPYEGNNKIYAMNATDGRPLWDFRIEGVVWNFMPSTPGDGTFLFATGCGVAASHRLADGGLIWRSALPEPGPWCSTGGGTLGPNGVFYVEGNWFTEDAAKTEPLKGVAPCHPGDCPLGHGLLIAHRARDGEILWARRIRQGFGAYQYPTVAEIGGRLTVVTGVGENPLLPTLHGEKFLPNLVRIALSRLQLRSGLLRRLMGIPVKRNALATFDAETGELLWFVEEEPWSYHSAIGDEEKLFERYARMMREPRHEPACGPDNWGIPAVTGDGTILMSSGSTGKLYAVRDANGDGHIRVDEEVSMLDTKHPFLNGPALAPGMLAVAPCWGKMYVFKS